MGRFDEILEKIANRPIQIFVSPKGIGFLWCYKNKGFGEIFVSLANGRIKNRDEYPIGRLHIESECESKEFVKKVICQAIDESDFR